MANKQMNNIQLNHDVHQATSKKHPLCFLANDIDEPMNIGSFFRIADALGVEKIYLSGNSVIPPNYKIKRTSRSTENHVSYSYEKDALGIVKTLKASAYKIVSLEITSISVDIKDFAIAKGEKICLILGSEANGICQNLLDVSDATIHIPMLGINSSMNVAMACAIASYEIAKKL